LGLGALTKFLALLGLNVLALIAAGTFRIVASYADDAAAQPPPRIEARSSNLLAVGIVHDDRMSIHLSRLIDNAPMRDAVLTVLLRGVVHPTTVEADGSYTLEAKDLSLPGPVSVVFQIAQGGVREDLKGALQIADNPPKPEQKNSARQLWWWVLNFVVCIGFLMLISRRRKAASKASTPD
jgi:hypothetical protein